MRGGGWKRGWRGEEGGRQGAGEGEGGRAYTHTIARKTRDTRNTRAYAHDQNPRPAAEDRAAAQRNLDVQFGTFADPLFFGKWPPLLQQKFGSATVQDWSPEEAARVRGSLDWLGINFYTGKFVKGNGNPLGYVVSAWDK